VSITGGKLTTYRVMAKDAVNTVGRLLSRRLTKARTATLALPGGELSRLEDAIADAARVTNDVALAGHLAASYGSRWKLVWQDISERGGNVPLHPGLPYTVGEARYCAAHEMACTLADVLVRRTHLAFETSDQGAAAAEITATAIGSVLGWDAAARAAAIAAYMLEIERLFAIDEQSS
jgi:glycerol-3-phosphate dehydrogenase